MRSLLIRWNPELVQWEYRFPEEDILWLRSGYPLQHYDKDRGLRFIRRSKRYKGMLVVEFDESAAVQDDGQCCRTRLVEGMHEMHVRFTNQERRDELARGGGYPTGNDRTYPPYVGIGTLAAVVREGSVEWWSKQPGFVWDAAYGTKYRP